MLDLLIVLSVGHAGVAPTYYLSILLVSLAVLQLTNYIVANHKPGVKYFMNNL